MAFRSLEEPSERRLAHDHAFRDAILAAHRRALIAGDRYYVDPATGFNVFTAAYLVARGTCCVSGCRHCPYVD